MARGIFLLIFGLLLSPGGQANADDDDDTSLFEEGPGGTTATAMTATAVV